MLIRLCFILLILYSQGAGVKREGEMSAHFQCSAVLKLFSQQSRGARVEEAFAEIGGWMRTVEWWRLI